MFLNPNYDILKYNLMIQFFLKEILPTHLGGLPFQTPLLEQCLVDPVPPSIRCPFTQAYCTVEGEVLFTILKTGCSGSPHIVESKKIKNHQLQIN